MTSNVRLNNINFPKPPDLRMKSFKESQHSSGNRNTGTFSSMQAQYN